jgi:hypothetical protein
MLAPPEELLADPGLADFTAPPVGWQAFANVEFIGQMVVVLLIAVVLAASIAYHPSSWAKASTLEELEQPKTFIMYSMVGALIAIIVKAQPSMALVVFGIGGLMRFRTNVGEAKDTGRVILVTVIGLCCGLELYVVAVLATALAWVLITALERSSIGRVVIQGLDKQNLDGAAEAYDCALRELGCTILGQDKRVKKGSVALIYRAPRQLERSRIEARFADISENRRGTVNWESS